MYQQLVREKGAGAQGLELIDGLLRESFPAVNEVGKTIHDWGHLGPHSRFHGYLGLVVLSFGLRDGSAGCCSSRQSSP